MDENEKQIIEMEKEIIKKEKTTQLLLVVLVISMILNIMLMVFGFGFFKSQTKERALQMKQTNNMMHR